MKATKLTSTSVPDNAAQTQLAPFLAPTKEVIVTSISYLIRSLRRARPTIIGTKIILKRRRSGSGNRSARSGMGTANIGCSHRFGVSHKPNPRFFESLSFLGNLNGTKLFFDRF
jgi:hypothetical protein